jgi:hypothetical protein
MVVFGSMGRLQVADLVALFAIFSLPAQTQERASVRYWRTTLRPSMALRFFC